MSVKAQARPDRRAFFVFMKVANQTGRCPTMSSDLPPTAIAFLQITGGT